MPIRWSFGWFFIHHESENPMFNEWVVIPIRSNSPIPQEQLSFWISGTGLRIQVMFINLDPDCFCGIPMSFCRFLKMKSLNKNFFEGSLVESSSDFISRQKISISSKLILARSYLPMMLMRFYIWAARNLASILNSICLSNHSKWSLFWSAHRWF